MVKIHCKRYVYYICKELTVLQSPLILSTKITAKYSQIRLGYARIENENHISNLLAYTYRQVY